MIAIPDTIQFQPHHAELVFSGDDHTYRLRGGEVLASVTGILKAEGIQQYGPSNSNSDYKMQVGTWVHQAIEWYEKGTLDEGNLSGGVALYLKSYKSFKKITGFKPILELIEAPMWHSSWRFSGTPDLPGVIADRFVICDLKTGEKRAGDCVQVAGYGMLVCNSVVGFENLAPEGAVVYIKNDGLMPKVEQVSAIGMHGNKSVFLAALQVNRWKKANNQ